MFPMAALGQQQTSSEIVSDVRFGAVTGPRTARRWMSAFSHKPSSPKVDDQWTYRRLHRLLVLVENALRAYGVG